MKDRTTYVYFIQAGYGAIKVGMAKNPEKRLANMQTSSSKQLRLLASFPMPDRQSARNLEIELHKAFAHEHIRGEWFNRRIVRIGGMKEIFGGTLKQPEVRQKLLHRTERQYCCDKGHKWSCGWSVQSPSRDDCCPICSLHGDITSYSPLEFLGNDL